MVRQGGDEMERALRARRDALPEASRDFYRLLADQVDVRNPDDAGPIEAKQVPSGVDVAVRRGNKTIFHRIFVREETSELRLLPGAGGVAIDPALHDQVPVRVAAHVDRSVETPRDWGHDLLFFPQLSYDGTRGLVFGTRAHLTRYGFELQPFVSDMSFAAAFATTALRPRLEFSADLRTHSPLRGLIYLAYTGMDALRFYGIGNETVVVSTGSSFFDVRQERFIGNPAVDVPLLGPLHGRVGLFLESVYTRRENIIATLQPYGSGGFTLAGGEAGVAIDTRSGVLTAQRGFKLLAKVRHSPAILDNETQFTKFRGEASMFVGARLLTDVLVDLRVAGEKNWGRYPFFESAFIGGAALVSGLDVNGAFGGGVLRGYDLNRFAGDSSIVGNAELRVALGKANLFLPLRYGVLGLGDTGRVFVANESSSRWHHGVGGGLWLAVFASAPGATIAVSLNASLVRSEEGTSFYFSSGFGL